MPRGGWAPCFVAPSGGRTPKGHLDSITKSLISKRLASLSRNSTALPDSSTAADISSAGAGVLSSVFSRGTCLLKRRSMLCRKLVHLCVSVLVFLCRCLRGCLHGTQSPFCNASLMLRVRSRRRAECCGSTVAFFWDHCALSEPVRLWHLWICRDLLVCMFLGAVCPLLPHSGVCSPACMNFSGSVLCAQCHPLFCDHPCSYWKWLGKQAKGVGGDHGRDGVPLPLPTPQTHQEVFLTCRLRTSLTSPVVGRERELGIPL